MEQERRNPHPKCPECGAETYIVEQNFGLDNWFNIFCTNDVCDWFTEVDK